jgi:hypothetical protein
MYRFLNMVAALRAEEEQSPETRKLRRWIFSYHNVLPRQLLQLALLPSRGDE